ncbi:hypothetical protein OIV83_006229 [Microbotryomycetes sp. JL201]|nr:hypothetical protein OIV83_006229 [Microbotryomycetes sp. JL201]
MSFPTNQLPAEFEQEHGSVDLLGEDTKPNVDDDVDGVEDEDLDVSRATQSVWLCKASLRSMLAMYRMGVAVLCVMIYPTSDRQRLLLILCLPTMKDGVMEDDVLHNAPKPCPASAAPPSAAIPKFLMEKWSNVEQEGRVLGRIRVFEELDSDGQNKVALILDNNNEQEGDEVDSKASVKPEPGSSLSTRDIKGKAKASPGKIGMRRGVPTEYKLSIQNRASKNLYVFGEKEEEDELSGEVGFRRKRRRTALAGTVHHECSLTPVLGASYSGIMRERLRKASEPVRKIKPLDVDQATANRLASGAGMHGIKGKITASSFVKTKQQQKSTPSGDRIQPRMPRNELLDLLFTYFDQAPYWHVKALAEHVKQPQVYLREVLTDVAELVPRGPYNGMWKLKPDYAGKERNLGTAVKPESAAADAAAPSDERDKKPQVDSMAEEDEDDDEEMVIVE